ncbi:hypothetical protein [Roseovarius aestuarii]|uniref:Uncharacterized protein n=1 Tax=Roseovarius aestuarii TaxID=475083 RepID=A0A1X7BQB4_9RHOB|nr:hypothetical protein [Roseovarius aestuarii]SMC11785.1 hypothetical protein ROA7745_01604 [Roseovarius aestuarii]
MVALPDTHMPDTPIKRAGARQVIEGQPETNPVKRALLAGFGVAALLSALGVWIVPVDQGDTAMQLVKLIFSILMLVLGMLFVSALDRRHAEPEIQIDPASRQLRIVEVDSRGEAFVSGDYNLDELSDITLRDRHLTARDAKGTQVVSVAVYSAAAEMAIRKMLTQAA